MDIARKPREMLIVGGGAIGVEYATIFSALGVPVTILDGAPRLAAMMDGEISQRLEEVFVARGSRVILGTGMVSVHRDGDDLAVGLADGRQLRPDALLFAAGRSVSTAGLGLENVGVQVDQRGRITVDSERRTSCPWVFSAGDVIGPTLASIAIDQGRQALCGALGLDFSAHVEQTPGAAVYGLPEVARGGPERGRLRRGRDPVRDRALRARHHPPRRHRGSGRPAQADLPPEDRSSPGRPAICEIASEITGIGQAMIHNQATIENVLRMAYNTPTYSYGYKLAAADTLTLLHPDVLQRMRLPSAAHRISPGRLGRHREPV